MTNKIETILKEITETALNKKALDQQYYHLNESYFIEHVLVFSANNKIHLKAILNELIKKAKSFPNECSEVRVSGTAESEWLILDIDIAIIHLVSTEIRAFYQLDEFFNKYTA
jgi:ribosome-associated protein